MSTAGLTYLPQRSRLVSRLLRPLRDVLVLARRNLIRISREPMQLSDVTIQPLLFTLLFVYVFGSGIPVPGGGDYVDFALAGLLALNLVTSSPGTAIGLSTDMNTGVMERFRTLPMWHAAVLAGRSLTDLASSGLCATIVMMTGLVIGWWPSNGVLSVVGGVAIVWLFGYALSWVMACLGLVSKDPESGMSMAFLVVFPLAFVSNALVPTHGMPGVLQAIVHWNPVSAVTAASRTLFGNANPAASIDAWPMQHPVLAAVLWSVAILAVAVPSAIWLFRRRTAD
jgi:ABC transporter DrrB family efflux protein